MVLLLLIQIYLGMVEDLDVYGQWDDVLEENFWVGLQCEVDCICCMNEEFDYNVFILVVQIFWCFVEFIVVNNQ